MKKGYSNSAMSRGHGQKSSSIWQLHPVNMRFTDTWNLLFKREKSNWSYQINRVARSSGMLQQNKWLSRG